MILKETNGPIATIKINRPEKLNALTVNMVEKLYEAIVSLDKDPEIRIVILTGNGDKAFIGGIDVNTFVNLNSTKAKTFISLLHGICLKIRTSEKIVIASINGYALGGGLEIAASCDLRISSEKAYFGMPEVRVGVPSVIEAAYLPKLIGLGRAQEMIYLGEVITASEAEKIGLVNKVVESANLKKDTMIIAEKILKNGPTAIRFQKKLIAKWLDSPLSDAIEAGIQVFADIFETSEPEEGCRAFLEKREPSYILKIH